jgi:hypothetical protein
MFLSNRFANRFEFVTVIAAQLSPPRVMSGATCASVVSEKKNPTSEGNP